MRYWPIMAMATVAMGRRWLLSRAATGVISRASHFRRELPKAKSVEILLYWDSRNPVPLTTQFTVHRAAPAIAQMFAKCEDPVPA